MPSRITVRTRLIALAGLLVAYRAEAMTTTTSTGQSYDTSYSDWWSQSTNYGEYGAGFAAGENTSSSADGLSAGVWGNVPVEIDDNTFTFLDVSLTATNNASDDATLTADVSVLGAQIFDYTVVNPSLTLEYCINDTSVSDINNSGEIVYSKTDDDLGISKTVYPYGVPVTISLEPSGCIGLTVALTYSDESSEEQLKLTGTPFTTIGLEGSAMIGQDGFGGGVACGVDMIDLSVPTTVALEATAPSYDLTYGYWSIVSLTSLSGGVDAFVELASQVVGSVTLWSWTGVTLGNWVILTDSTPTITDPTVSASTGYETSAVYTYYDSNGLSDQSTFIWSQGTDSNGSNSTQVSTSGNAWNIMPLSSDSTSGGYAKYCVTPNNGLHSGTQKCSSWLELGKLARTFGDSNYGGTNYNFAYQASGVANGACLNFPSSFNDSMSSFEVYAPSNANLVFDFYNYDNCSTELMPGTVSSGGSGVDSSLGSKHDNAVNSVRVAAPDSVSASNVQITISGNTASGSYTYGGGGFSESGSTYAIQRASAANGSSATTVSTSTSWTLESADNEQYLRFCVTPEDEFNTTGAQQCSGWTSVGHLIELYENESYGGSSVNLAYEQSGSGTCFNMTTYNFNDTISALKFYGTSTNASTLWLYQNTDCGSGNTSAETATTTESTNGVDECTNTGDTYGKSWNDSISSVMVTWD